MSFSEVNNFNEMHNSQQDGHLDPDDMWDAFHNRNNYEKNEDTLLRNRPNTAENRGIIFTEGRVNPDDLWDIFHNRNIHEGGDIKNSLADNDLKNEKSEGNEKETEIQMPKIIIVFKYPDNCDKDEYDRQLKGQENGMNKLSIYEYLENRKQYKDEGRKGEDAQKEYREKALAERIESNRNNGMSYEEAKEEAEKWISDKAALHEPDQIAGGNPNNVSDIGSASVNASIGAQWKGKIQDVDNQIKDFAKNLSDEEKKNIKLNVELKGV